MCKTKRFLGADQLIIINELYSQVLSQEKNLDKKNDNALMERASGQVHSSTSRNMNHALQTAQ